MALVDNIDSSVVGLTYSEEDSIGVLKSNPIFIALEPNTFGDFGATVSTVARNFINSSRQRSKGTVTDVDAVAGFQMDMTQLNFQDLLQGFFQADFRKKGEVINALGTTTFTIAAAATNSRFTVAGTGVTDLTTIIAVGQLVFMAGFANAANNGLFVVTAVTSTTIDVAEADGSQTAVTLVDESATSNGELSVVGFECADSDLDISTSGSLPQLTTTSLDFTTLGLVEGELIFIGGDASGTFFSTNVAANNVVARIRTIAANALTLDKANGTMVAESSGASDQIHIYYASRVLKNEQGSLIKRRSVQFERTLGANDDAATTNLQADYVIGCVGNELTFNFNQADKITADLAFVATNGQTLDENNLPSVFPGTTTTADAIKSQSTNLGSSVHTPSSGAAFNTSSDFARIKLAGVSDTDENPASQFAFATEMSLVVNGNVSPLKALGELGAFGVNTGQFEVSGTITAYFSTVAAIEAVQNNDDITLDIFVAAKDKNRGFFVDLPLLSLGDARPNIELNQPITLPLTFDAARGQDVSSTLDHTMMMGFYPYLPDRANP